MTAPTLEVPRTELPFALVLAVGATCGVLAAMVTQILLAQRGIDLAAVWHALVSARGLQLRAAGAWWMMAASGFIVGAVVAGVLSRTTLPWVRLRALRWIAAAAIVAALAHVGHSASGEPANTIGAEVATSLAGLFASGLMSLFGAYFAAKR
jgi:hypothetical protein